MNLIRDINKHGKLPVKLLVQPSLKSYLPGRYYTRKNKMKSRNASMIVDLRIQFGSFCCEVTYEDLIHNPIIGYEDGENQHQWNFAHRHGFPSDLKSAGRGQGAKVTDIMRHPLSYFLLSFDHHQEYDIYNGDWRNPKKYKTEIPEEIYKEKSILLITK